MTAIIVHGNPGSYKSSALINEFGIPALKAGRTVVSNIRGFDDIERVESAFNLVLPPGAELMSVPFKPEGFEHIARFHHWLPEGAVLLVDEVQRCYPTRLKSLSEFDIEGKGRETPEPGEYIRTVEEAFDCHRHMNWDIYLSTTHIKKCHAEIRAVAEFGYRHKNLAGVLPGLRGRYKKVKHDPENNGKSLTNVLGSSIAKMDSRVFDVYKSTATGKTKDTTESASLWTQPKLLFGVALVGIAVLFALARSGGSTAEPEAVQVVEEKPSTQVAGSIGSLPVTTSGGVPADSQFQRNDAKGAARRQLIESVRYLTAVVRRGHTPEYWFQTDDNQSLSGNDLMLLDVRITQLGRFVILESDDVSRVVFPSRQQPEPIPVNVVASVTSTVQQSTNDSAQL